MKKGVIVLCWLVVFVWMWVIFYFSALPEEPVSAGTSLPGYITKLPFDEVPQSGSWMPDYVNHGAAYLVLAFFLFFAWQRTWQSRLGIAFAVIFVWCLIFGLGNEINQYYLPTGRDFSWWDVLADGVGAGLLFAFLVALQKAGEWGRQSYSFLMGKAGAD